VSKVVNGMIVYEVNLEFDVAIAAAYL